ncbi:MAG: glycosyltransferase family 4 protein, partial [Halobacteriota archaeon]
VDTQRVLPQNVSVHYLGAARDTFLHYFYFQVACLRWVPHMIKKYHIDIVHSHNTMPDLFLSPQRLRVPVISTIHTVEDERLPIVRDAVAKSGVPLSKLERSEKLSVVFERGLHAAGRAYFRNNRHYIAVSRWTKAQILRHHNVDPGRIRVIPNGVDTQTFSPENERYAREQFPELADVGRPTILFLSRKTASKGIFVLLKAIGRVLDKVDASFIVAGPGKMLSQSACPSVASQISKHVTELGYVRHELTGCLHSLADVFVLPSFYENCPLGILEAMASRRSVVASDIPGISELITDKYNGLLTQSGNAEQLAQAIITLITDGTMKRELERNARQMVEKHHDWRQVAAEVSDYYTSLLASPGT